MYKMPLVHFLINFIVLPAFFANAWDVAVITKQDVEFFRNGSALGVGHGYLKDLSVGAYDPVHGYLYVSDASHPNTSIFRVNTQSLKDDADPSAISFQPVVSKQASVQGIVFDPISATLFWTTGGGNTILKYILSENDDSVSMPQQPGMVLHAFRDGSIPRGITVDSCRKTIYWTNIKPLNASIERSNMDGTNRTVIVPSWRNEQFRLFQPYGIIVDQKSDHLYWCDVFEDNSYQIVRSNLDGGDAKIVISHSGQEPYGLTIAGDRLYWTDQHYGSLYSLPLASNDPSADLTLVKKFGPSVRPDGVISNTLYQNLKSDHCPGLNSIEPQIKQLYQKESPIFSPNERMNDDSTSDDCPKSRSPCLHGGKFIDGVCKCSKGYKGSRCEYPICFNYCYNGVCAIDQDGSPVCKCNRGWTGLRCEIDRCQGFCSNNGQCVIENNDKEPKCKCAPGFSGLRCEIETDVMDKICKMYCAVENLTRGQYLNEETTKNFKTAIDSLSQKSLRVCSCPPIIPSSPSVGEPAAMLNINDDHGTSKLGGRSNVVLIGILAVSCVCLGGIVVILSSKVLKLRRRPRIKKRIVVSRPSIPFCRPPAAPEQCEITIENCCNMNICETPCFEPEFRSSKPTFSKHKSEDKRGLISSMCSNSSLEDENQ